MIFRTGHARPATSSTGVSTPTTSTRTPHTTLPGPCLLPSVVGLYRARDELAAGFVAAAYGDWDDIRVSADPPATRPVRRLIRRFLARAPIVGTVLILTWALPGWLSLNPDAATTFRISLLIPAILALLAPQDALAEAQKIVSNVRTGPSTDTRPGAHDI